MEINQSKIEALVREVLSEVMDEQDTFKTSAMHGVKKIALPSLQTRPQDRLDTGKEKDIVYTRDLFTLEESPRLGCGLMEMEHTSFDWHLTYDEIDYVIEGRLTIIIDGKKITAGPGEIILIPKDSKIQFSVPEKARFMYVTYPADWAG
ncbi:cupin domain-containing protein [Streptococcus devriesei]|uniref:cupin domain-containing protein n=1 Tax=Streptococcus devriesei TaxID=231233 RepID=UPI0004183BB7|nr:cupin domain-containing protein [Streptococcus devriesei]